MDCTPHKTATREDWLSARTALLEREKAHMRASDALATARRELPWVKVEKDYVFTTEDGEASLADLFGGHGQLAVYHFMYGPEWEAGCPSCSFWIDNLNGVQAHLAQRDVRLVLISHAPLDKLLAYRARMGWSLPWVSSHGSEFNRDWNVSFTAEEIDSGNHVYNYREGGFGVTEAPGFSAFAKGDDGAVYHSYSTFARGLEHFNGAYQLLDLMPKGRDEGALPFTQAWLKRRDEYGAAAE